MNTTLSKVLIFAAGAAIGSLVTWKVLDKKLKDEYEQRLADDTASIKEAFADTNLRDMVDVIDRVVDVKTPDSTIIADPTPLSDLESRVQRLNYITEDSVDLNKEKRPVVMDDIERPEVIDPNEYGEYADYDQVTLYYYADDVLADDMDNAVEDVEDIVGSYALTTFGQYEDDAVHVRNDRKRCYYEILRSDCAYSEKYGLNLYEEED